MSESFSGRNSPDVRDSRTAPLDRDRNNSLNLLSLLGTPAERAASVNVRANKHAESSPTLPMFEITDSSRADNGLKVNQDIQRHLNRSDDARLAASLISPGVLNKDEAKAVAQNLDVARAAFPNGGNEKQTAAFNYLMWKQHENGFGQPSTADMAKLSKEDLAKLDAYLKHPATKLSDNEIDAALADAYKKQKAESAGAYDAWKLQREGQGPPPR